MYPAVESAATQQPVGARSALAAMIVMCLLLMAACSSGGDRAPRARRPAVAGPALAPRPFPVAENQRPGTRAWQIRTLGAPGAIEGFADRVSVLPGQSFRLFVSTTAHRWRLTAFRMGWYGGAQARQVWASGDVTGRVQRAAWISPVTRMVTAPWRPSLTVSTAGWPEGAYLLRLAAAGGARYVPITVRSLSTAGTVVLLEDVTTWQAYNKWGGYDLYAGPGGFLDRSYAVSFDRPYDANGADRFFAYDQPAIALAERIGVPLAYETDVDLHADPGLLAGARAVVSLGHDEYYSAAMRDHLMAARNAGVNIAFLGANAIFRHVRFASSRLGADRVTICYKDPALDPLYGVRGADTTQDWREPPRPRPESVLTGVFYQCNPVDARYVVYDPGSWVFAATGVRRGESFAGLVGPEYDGVDTSVPVPRPMEVLAHSPVVCRGAAGESDSVYYTARSGAGVFAAGTMRWVCAMQGRACGHGVTAAAQRFVDIATTTVLRAFAAGPAGLTHPARDNLARLRLARGYTGSPAD